MITFTVNGVDLPPTLSTDAAAELLGMSADTIYEQRRRGEFPIEPIQAGRVLRWPTARVLELLGITPQRDNAPVGAGASSATVIELPSREEVVDGSA